jgi:hypothetical protein
LIPNPIRKVLSTFQNCEVRALLMGGQACVFYGAAEFSRDADFAILAEAANLEKLRKALEALQAAVIAVPGFSASFLERGHAIHFRCQHPEAARIRVDIMSKMRGVAAFPALWDRRTTLQSDDGTLYELLSLPDLVAAKKTQRDKDWPMIRRLIEAHYAAHENAPTEAQIQFWLLEARTPELLTLLAKRFPEIHAKASKIRPLLRVAEDVGRIAEALVAEEQAERARDREYWAPLRSELESIRRQR